MSDEQEYEQLLGRSGSVLPGLRIGRPGRSRMYWFTIAAMRLLRLRLKIHFEGAEHLRRGTPAILVANHTSVWDPVCVVISGWWRVIAFAKSEYFRARGAFFFRWMGQIPLKRGDAAATAWALAMAQQALTDGSMIGIYPEGTRSPDGRLHKLHKRVLIPLLQANPAANVHAVTMAYDKGAGRRLHVTARISPPLDLAEHLHSPDRIIACLRDALVDTGGQEYVDEYAQSVKERRRSGGGDDSPSDSVAAPR